MILLTFTLFCNQETRTNLYVDSVLSSGMNWSEKTKTDNEYFAIDRETENKWTNQISWLISPSNIKFIKLLYTL
jgi:hypothetical protein